MCRLPVGGTVLGGKFHHNQTAVHSGDVGAIVAHRLSVGRPMELKR